MTFLVQRFYRVIFFVFTSFYNFLVIVTGIIEKLNLWIQKQSKPGTTSALIKSGAETILMENAGSELVKLKKLPHHIACLLTEDIIDMERIVSVIQWCATAGIGCISLYDYNGLLVSNADLIQRLLSSSSSSHTKKLKEKYYSVHQGFTSESSIIDLNEIHVFLLYHKDGRPLFSELAKKIAKTSPVEEINQSAIEWELNSLCPKEPELLLQFGTATTHLTLGYPPWHIHLTEMLRVPSHLTVRAEHIASALMVYGRCEQRFGK